VPQVQDEKIGRKSLQLFRRGDSGPDGNDANVISARGQNIGGGIADQRDGRKPADPTLAARAPDREPNQASAGGSHFTECAEAEIAAKPGALELAPSDPCEISGDEPEQRAAPREALEQRLHARAVLRMQNWAHPHVITFRHWHNARKGLADLSARSAGPPHHNAENIGVKHALHWNAFGRSFESGHAADAMNQGFPMMRPGAPDQSAIDIEKDKCAVKQAR